MTVSGRHLFSGFSVRVEGHICLYHLLGRIWLIVVTVVSDIESGAPSATMPEGILLTFRPRASGVIYHLEPHAHVVIRHHAKR
jgi:hypothetical protein